MAGALPVRLHQAVLPDRRPPHPRHRVGGGWPGRPVQKKVNFYTRQYIDALSPSNFALTNPEVFRETVKSHGQNLIKGLNNLLRDVEGGRRQPARQDDRHPAFELGKNVATTPGKVVFQTDLMQLIQYTRAPGRPQAPLLIVPPWINKFYILDLREKNLHQVGVDQGHTVFVISWVNPDERLAEKSFEDLSEKAPGRRRRHRRADRREGNQRAGYCLGGTLLADHAGLHGRQEGQAHRLRHLLHHHDRLRRAGRTRRLHRRRPDQQPRRRCSSAATSKAPRWPAPSTCCAPTT